MLMLNGKRSVYKGFAAILAACMTLEALGMAPGMLRSLASPEFARTAEEWAVLRDDLLTWDEIPGLINEYNATIIDNREDFVKDERRTMDAQDIREAMIKQADDYDIMAMDIAGTSEAQASQYRSQANTYRQQAEDNVTDRDILLWNYERIEAATVLNARIYFLEYYSALEQQKKAKASAQAARLSYQSVQNQFNVGMATQMQVLTAKEALDNAEAAVITADTGVQSAKKLLQVTCGWAYDAEAKIGELPGLDMTAIDAIDLASDTETAIKNNYTLKSDERMLQNTSQSNNFVDLREKYEKQLRDDTDQVRASVRSAYDSLMNAKTAYQNATVARSLAEDTAATAERNLSLGQISSFEYSSALSSRDLAVYDEEISRIALLSAKASYDACIQGLASAGDA